MNKYKFKLYQVVAFFVVVIIVSIVLNNISYLANTMAKVSKINNDSWLNFLGSLLGAVVTVIGAFEVTRKQFEANEKKSKEEKDEQSKIIQQIISLLIKDEVDKNKKLYEKLEERKKQLNLAVYSIKKGDKFFSDEWTSIKYELIKYINQSSVNQLLLSLVKLYNLIDKINIEISKYNSYFPISNELNLYLTELNQHFIDVYTEINKIN